MTRLLCVHGIPQEGKSSAILKEEWVGALNKGLAKAGAGPITSATRTARSSPSGKKG